MAYSRLIAAIPAVLMIAACRDDCGGPVAIPLIARDASASVANPSPLLALVPDSALRPEQRAWIATIRARRFVQEAVAARLVDSVQALVRSERDIAIPLSPSLAVFASGRPMPSTSPPSLSWAGTIGTSDGTVQLLLGSVGMHGTVQLVTARSLYSIEPLLAGIHAISRVGPFPGDEGGVRASCS